MAEKDDKRVPGDTQLLPADYLTSREKSATPPQTPPNSAKGKHNDDNSRSSRR